MIKIHVLGFHGVDLAAFSFLTWQQLNIVVKTQDELTSPNATML